MWYVYTMKILLKLKKNKMVPFAETWMDLDTVIMSEVSLRNTYDIAYLWNIKKWYKHTCLQSRNRLSDLENKIMITKG